MVETVRARMVDTVRPMLLDLVRNWPEYQKQFEMLREKVLEKDRMIELLGELRELFLQGIIFND
jgi:hypothetical protein